ncbi:MAG: PEGA domain-containing protein [Spirochaetes bacterium]|nr:PEGA domain-containing protein [Spirochaetota bacterium]
MKKIIFITILFLYSCSTVTTFKSQPAGAKAYLNGEYIGDTPVTIELSNCVLNDYVLELKMPGQKDFKTNIKREAKPAPIIIGVIGCLPLVLWGYGPKSTYDYELEKDMSFSTLVIDKKSGMTYYLDGVELKKSENFVAPGDYSLKIMSQDQTVVEFIMTLEADYEYKLSEMI